MDTDLSTTLLSAADNKTRTLANLSLGAPNMQPGFTSNGHRRKPCMVGQHSQNIVTSDGLSTATR